MARKKHAEEHVNLERWLISYADFITLLFATFVVLYALSQLDLAKFKDLKISLAKAFSASPTVFKGEPGVLDKKSNDVMDSGGQAENQNLIPPLLDQPYTQKENADFKETAEDINDNKSTGAAEIKGVNAKVTERGLEINMLGNVVFEPGSATIKKESYKTLEAVGSMIKTKFPNHLFRVEGHTDSQAMKSTIYPSNWELSSARASAIIRFLIDKFDIPSNRFSAVGYAESRPAALNDTEKGRNTNRRVEIVVLKNKLLGSEVVSDEFKKDLKNEISKFRSITKVLKKVEEPITSDAVEKLLEESKSKGNVIIFDTSNDAYQKDSAKMLQDIKRQEEQAEEETKARKSDFFKSIKKSF